MKIIRSSKVERESTYNVLNSRLGLFKSEYRSLVKVQLLTLPTTGLFGFLTTIQQVQKEDQYMKRISMFNLRTVTNYTNSTRHNDGYLLMLG